MKNILLLTMVLLFGWSMNAQETASDTIKRNELSTNLLDLVVAGSLNFNYERLFDNNQSLFAGITFFDTYGYYDAGSIDNSNAITLKLAYQIYFSKNKQHAGFFFYPQVRFRTGEVTVDDFFFFSVDDQSNIEQFKYDTAGIGVGFGIGHKWTFKNRFTLTLNGEIARNLGNFDDDYLSEVEGRFGVIFGYRF